MSVAGVWLNKMRSIMNQEAESACNDFLYYHQAILRPAAEEFDGRMIERSLKLHHVIQMNMLAAHMLDYLMEIRVALGLKEGRGALVKEFDERFAVKGARFLNRKFQLVDAVNNAVKHVVLEKERYKEVFSEYGKIGFRCLREDSGLILFEGEGYRFDFSRVVLRPVLAVVVPLSFDEVDRVAEFATDGASDEITADDRDDDPIDQMINYCNPNCPDCGEGEDGCRCSEFLYAGSEGEFRSDQDRNFDIDAIMTRISGAYRRS